MSLKISSKIKLAARNDREDHIIQIGDTRIGGKNVVVIAGPCSVESKEQLMEAAYGINKYGASLLRGGAFKPRTLPYSFQGLGVEGLKILADARDETGLPIVTEVMACEEVTVVEEYADVLQVGARNTQNYPLLKRLGDARKPVLLKRGLSSTIEEWLGSAEYILNGGNEDVMLCERGIRTFSQLTRFTLDLTAVPLLKEITNLPVIVDPSHGTGIRSLVSPMAAASVAAGADGIMIEVHPKPEEAMSDGAQSLTVENFASLMAEVKPVASAIGKTLGQT